MELALYLKNSATAPGFDEILYPGEIEHRNELKQRDSGIFVEDSTIESLEKLAGEFGVADQLF